MLSGQSPKMAHFQKYHLRKNINNILKFHHKNFPRHKVELFSRANLGRAVLSRLDKAAAQPHQAKLRIAEHAPGRNRAGISPLPFFKDKGLPMEEHSENLVTIEMDIRNPPALTAAQKAELAALAGRPDSEIDYSDIPPIDDFSEAFHPDEERTVMSVRLDADIVA